MARKRVKSEIQKAYLKQEKRIKQFIRRAEKRGYQFIENILPTRPQRFTKKSVQRLQEMTPQAMYKKAEYIDYSTGEILSGLEGRHLENVIRAKKASETRHYNKYDIRNQRKTDYDVIKRIEQLIRSSQPHDIKSKYTDSQKHIFLIILNHGKMYGEEYEKYLYSVQEELVKSLSDIQYESDPKENKRLEDRIIYYLSFEGSPLSLEQIDNSREENVDDITRELMEENPFL